MSAGLALAQTLPTGSAMLFSVDYRLDSGRPNPSFQYAWGIERSRGEPQIIAIALDSEGTLQAVSLDWPPGEGPYKSYLIEISSGGERREISNQREMTTTGE